MSLDLRCFTKSRTETAVLYADAVYLNIEGERGSLGVAAPALRLGVSLGVGLRALWATRVELWLACFSDVLCCAICLPVS